MHKKLSYTKYLLIAAFISSSALAEQPVLFCSESISGGIDSNESMTAYGVSSFQEKRFKLKFNDDFSVATIKGYERASVDREYRCGNIWPENYYPEEIQCHGIAVSIAYNAKTNKGTLAQYYGDISVSRGKIGDDLGVSVFTCDEF